MHPKGPPTLPTNGHPQAACAAGIPRSQAKVFFGVSWLTLLGRYSVNAMFSDAIVFPETQRSPSISFERIPNFIHPL